MGKIFVFTIICLSVTLVISALLIWDSIDEAEEASYISQFLRDKAAETRENAATGGVPEVDPDRDPDPTVDYSKLTPGLQQFIREGKPNPEITVDLVR